MLDAFTDSMSLADVNVSGRTKMTLEYTKADTGRKQMTQKSALRKDDTT